MTTARVGFWSTRLCRMWLIDINAGKVQFFFQPLKNWSPVDVEKEGSLIKTHPLRSWYFLFLLDWMEAFILSLLLKLSPRRLNLLFIMWSLFLLTLHVISMNQPFNFTWNSYSLDKFEKLEKWVWIAVGPALAASFKLLTYRLNTASANLFYQY